ncbi:type II toxin-antitoxin system RelB/DinJ family antitoxin [Rhizobium sp. FY34]|uniref:type II toxin-antitoxin system RelB/DinJ family antitoxin n=1 Tax=Rhizobium sp. FY34 TaxID=2562309 RepID=UPI0019823401|nr:type II toxin-antitoxin system RelB/DinJ family antitoxin [Rhizobium sp. FY34]
MSSEATVLPVPIDEDTKRRATDALGAVGLSLPQAVRMFLDRVVEENGYPAALTIPNTRTLEAMAEARAIVSERRARFNSAEALLSSLEKSSGR